MRFIFGLYFPQELILFTEKSSESGCGANKLSEGSVSVFLQNLSKLLRLLPPYMRPRAILEKIIIIATQRGSLCCKV